MNSDLNGFENYDDILVVDDVMKILRLGRNNTLRLLQDGKIKCLRIGRKYRIPKKNLIDFIYSNEAEAQEA